MKTLLTTIALLLAGIAGAQNIDSVYVPQYDTVWTEEKHWVCYDGPDRLYTDGFNDKTESELFEQWEREKTTTN